MLRRGRPILRTAAIVGTASAVGGAVSHHQQQKYAAQDAQATQEAPPQYYEAQPPPPPAAAADPTAELTKLAELHNQGILTDEEFSAKKAQILGI
jgi:Short C-terminal domain